MFESKKREREESRMSMTKMIDSWHQRVKLNLKDEDEDGSSADDGASSASKDWIRLLDPVKPTLLYQFPCCCRCCLPTSCGCIYCRSRHRTR